MGPRLGRVEYMVSGLYVETLPIASMGPRLGRVEYDSMEDGQQVSTTLLQWGHA